MKTLSLIVTFCVLSTLASGQGSSPSTAVGNPIAFGRSGFPLSGATVAICAGQPTAVTPCGGSSLVQTYTTPALSITCGLNAGPGQLNGAGCTNPGLTDGLGNVVAYGLGGGYWCQYYGANIVGAQASPCPFVAVGPTLSWSNPGVFTAGAMHEYVTSIINGCNSTTEEGVFGGGFATNGMTSCLSVPATSAVDFAKGIASYVVNSAHDDISTASAIYGQCRLLGNDESCIGGQFWVGDAINANTFEELVALQAVVKTFNNAAAYELVYGIQATAIFGGTQPSPSQAFRCAYGGGASTWNTCFASDDGQGGNYLLRGGATATSGTASSQAICLHGINAGVDSQEACFYVDSAGNWNLAPSAGLITIATGGVRQGLTGTNVTLHQHKRISTGSIGGTTRVEVLLTWTNTFTDTSYTAACNVEDSTTAAGTQGLTLERIRTKSATQVGLIINNPTGGALTGTLDCIADHD